MYKFLTSASVIEHHYASGSCHFLCHWVH